MQEVSRAFNPEGRKATVRGNSGLSRSILPERKLRWSQDRSPSSPYPFQALRFTATTVTRHFLLPVIYHLSSVILLCHHGFVNWF